MNKTSHSQSIIGIFTTLYAGLLIYGTLYPITAFEYVYIDWTTAFSKFLTSSSGKSDLIVNALIYIPFGFLLYRSIFYDKKSLIGLGMVTLVGIALSMILEFTQLYLAHRTTSLLDLLLNSSGAFIGSLMALNTGKNSALGKRLLNFKRDFFVENHLASLGLLVILFWLLSQLAPLVPAPGWSFIKDSIKPLFHTLSGAREFDDFRFAYYALSLTSIGLVLSITLKRYHNILSIFSLLLFFVMVSKIIVLDRQISLEMIIGAIVSTILVAFLDHATISKRAQAGVILITLSLIISQSAPGSNASTNEFMWIPFVAQMQNVIGLLDLIYGIWPYLCCAFFVSIYSHSRGVIITGSIVVLLFSSLLEYAQTQIPGRYPDITDVIMAVSGWFLYFSIMHLSEINQQKE